MDPPLLTDWGLSPLSDQEFALFQALVLKEAGISLGPTKKSLVYGRLAKRIRELGLRNFSAYYQKVAGEHADLAERSYMIDCICTNETHFFRDPRHFTFLETTAFPEWEAQAQAGKRARRVKLWSAACSTGEEPYTLAMTLLNYFGADSGWQLEVLATDLSNKVLERARQALWPLEKASEIPPDFLKAFMLRGSGPQAGKMKAGPEIRRLVRFQRFNLNDDQYEVDGPFDAIFCRNVMIYFNHDLKVKVVNRLLRHLAPEGYLFLGSAESLSGITNRAKNVQPSVYRAVSQ